MNQPSTAVAKLPGQHIETQGRETGEVATAAVTAREVALIRAGMEWALSFPRSWDKVREKLEADCKRESFAEVAEYSKPQGKDKKTGEQLYVAGPSIRFVESAMRYMGNLRCTRTVVVDNDEKRILEVGVHDLENNLLHSVPVTINKTVERLKVYDDQVVISFRPNHDGNKLFKIKSWDDVVVNNEANQAAKAQRGCGLKIMPADLVEDMMDIVHATMEAAAAKDPKKALSKLVASFDKVGVTVADLEKYLKHPLAAGISTDELKNLRLIFTGIKEEVTTWKEVIEGAGSTQEGEKKTGVAGLKEKIADKKAAVTGSAKPAEPVAGNITREPGEEA